MDLVLKRLGFEVRTTTSAAKALDLVASEPFDVVLTDLGLNEMSGLSLCERILGTRPDMIVIVVTGQGSMDHAIQAMRVGAFDFLTKPVDQDLLGIALAR